MSTFLLIIVGTLFWVNIVIALWRAGDELLFPTGRSALIFPAVLSILTVLLTILPSIAGAGEFLVSDGVEYAVAAMRIREHGDYLLPFQGLESIPPRFPIWFSLVIVSPFYVLAGDITAGIYAIGLSIVVCASAAFILGAAIAGRIGGILAAFSLLAVPGFSYFSQSILTDIPSCAIFLILALLFLAVQRGSDRANLMLAYVGVISAFAYGFRVTNIVFLLPFLIQQSFRQEPFARRFGRLLILVFPTVLVGLFGAYANKLSFGSYVRTGYHFWAPIPYEFFSLTFSTSFLKNNFYTVLVTSGLVPFGAAFFILRGFNNQRIAKGAQRGVLPGALLKYFLLTMIPLAAIFLLYFYTSLRLYLPVGVSAALLLAVEVARLIPPDRRFPFGWAFLVGGFIVAAWYAGVKDVQTPVADTVASIVRECTPQTAVVSAINPLLLEYRLHGICGRIVPASRSVEYAAKAMLRRPLLDGEALGTTREFALRNGGQDVYEQVATEIPALPAGTLIALTAMNSDEIAWLSDRYKTEPTAYPHLLRIKE